MRVEKANRFYESSELIPYFPLKVPHSVVYMGQGPFTSVYSNLIYSGRSDDVDTCSSFSPD
jgi:hypothetical protein